MTDQDRTRALLGELANLGVRAPDMEAEVAFLEMFGATNVHRTQGARGPRTHLELGTTRMTLFPRATYDDRLDELGEPRGGGLGHVAFKVASTDRIVEALAAKGYAPLIPTFTVPPTPTGGMRRVTYFRSPNGTVIETQETVEDQR